MRTPLLLAGLFSGLMIGGVCGYLHGADVPDAFEEYAIKTMSDLCTSEGGLPFYCTPLETGTPRLACVPKDDQ